MQFLYFILHTFIGCHDDDLENSCGSRRAKCKKCGREFFIWNIYK